MNILARAATLGDALDRWYRPERLNRDLGSRQRLIDDRLCDIMRDGLATLASRHDSVTGRTIMAIEDADGYLIHES